MGNVNLFSPHAFDGKTSIFRKITMHFLHLILVEVNIGRRRTLAEFNAMPLIIHLNGLQLLIRIQLADHYNPIR